MDSEDQQERSYSLFYNVFSKSEIFRKIILVSMVSDANVFELKFFQVISEIQLTSKMCDFVIDALP